VHSQELVGVFGCVSKTGLGRHLPARHRSGRLAVRPGQDLSLTGLAKVVEDFCAALDLTGVDLVANDTGGAVAQIVAAHQPERLATVTLTNCETQGNVPPLAFKPMVWPGRCAGPGPRRLVKQP
jgi:pimeloyl-ACP methyl ester carboxylesterase